MTKGASALQSSPPQPTLGILFCSRSLLSGASHFLPGRLRNVPSANQHTRRECPHPRWLVIIVLADAKNVVQLSKLACNINTRGNWDSTDKCRELCRVKLHSHFFNVLDNGKHDSNKPSEPPPPGIKGIHDVRCSSVDFFIYKSKRFPKHKKMKINP